MLFLLAANLWVYLNQIAPREKIIAMGGTRQSSPLGDLYPRWRGTQELFDHRLDPYGPEVSADIQIALYGKVLVGDRNELRPGEPRDEQRFAYPVYVAFLLAPFIHLPFETVRLVFRWLLLAITLASIPCWLKLAHASVERWTLLVIAALTFSSVPVMQALNLQQLALFVAAILAATAALMVSGRLFLAGAILSLASIKPQMCVLVMTWLVLWVFSEWRTRKQLLWGLLIAMLVLTIAGEAISPGWVRHFLGGMVAYNRYTGGGTLLTMLLPKPLAIAVSVACVAVVAATCWRTRREPASSLAFALTFCLALSLTIVVVPTVVAAFNQIFLLPAFFLVANRWRSILQRDLRSRSACLVMAALALSPWPLAVMVTLLRVLGPERVFKQLWASPVYLSLLLPFAGFALLVFLLKDVYSRPLSSTSGA